MGLKQSRIDLEGLLVFSRGLFQFSLIGQLDAELQEVLGVGVQLELSLQRVLEARQVVLMFLRKGELFSRLVRPAKALVGSSQGVVRPPEFRK